MVEQLLEHLDVHALDLAGEELVHAVQDADRVSDDGVGAGGAQVNGREAFEDFMRQAVGGGQGQLERRFIGHGGAVEVGGRNALLGGQRPDLGGGAVDEHDADAQGTQHGDVHQDVGEVLVRDDRAVHVNDERLLAELGDVLQDAPQVGQFHVRFRFGFRSGDSPGAAGLARAVLRASRQRLFSFGVPMEMRTHSGNW